MRRVSLALRSLAVLLCAAAVAADAAANSTAEATTEEECEYASWGDWGECVVNSNECVQTRFRPPVGDGIGCVPETEFQTCDPQLCAEDLCEAGEWGEWTACSLTCGPGGTQTRYREVYTGGVNITCPHLAMNETQACFLRECARPTLRTSSGNLDLVVPEGRTVQFTNSSGTFTLGDIEAAATDYAAAAAAKALTDGKAYTDQSAAALRLEIGDAADTTALAELSDAIDQVADDAQADADEALSKARTYTDTAKTTLENSLTNLETTLLDALEGVDGSHIENHEDQAAAIALLDEEQVENRNRISALESDKASKDALADLASEVSELREDYAELSTSHEALKAQMARLLPGPPTALTPSDIWADQLTVSWTPPPSSALPVVEYKAVISAPGLTPETKQIVDNKVTFTGLARSTTYTVAVASVNVLGEGDATQIDVRTVDQNVMGRAYECGSGWAVPSAMQPGVTTVCSIEVTLPYDFIAHGAFTGHAQCSGSGWIYGRITMPGDTGPPGSDAATCNAHTYVRRWDTFRSSRVKRFPKGTHVFSMQLTAETTTCSFNGGRLNLVTIAADTPNFKTFGCTPQAWENRILTGQNGQIPCSTEVSTTVESVAYATFTSHAKVANSWLYAAVSLNDATGSDVESNAKQYLSGHTYATEWVNMYSGRARALPPGANQPMRVVGFRRGGNNEAFMNGVGMTGMTFPLVENWSGVFECQPEPWGVTANSNPITSCSTTITLPHRSVVFAEFNGHCAVADGSTCYGSVSFDNDAIPGLTQYTSSPANHMLSPAHTYSTQWTTFGNARWAILDAGQHTVRMQIACRASGNLNGAGLSGYYVRYRD